MAICLVFNVFLATVACAVVPADADIAPARAAYERLGREILGKCPPSVRFAVDPSLDVVHDEYRIVSEGESAAFVGASRRAVLYAVYDFFARRAGCRYYWDGDVVPKAGKLDFAGLDVREKSRFEYRAIRYFAHRGLTRFQAEHWGLDDWKRELDWCAKRRVNVVMPRLGAADDFQRAFPDVVPYPDPAAKAELEGFDNRADYWSLRDIGRLRDDVRAYAQSLGLMMPEDFGTMTHWYSRTPRPFLEKMQPPFLPQQAGNYREDSGRVWDVREQKWLDAYFKLTEARIGGRFEPELVHTIGLGERRAYTNRADNLALKTDVLHRLIDGARSRWPKAKVLIAGWDFFSTWRSQEVSRFVRTLDPSSTLIWDYEGDNPLNGFGKITEWDVVGKFPYTYGFFINSASGCDVRANYDLIERRGRRLVADPFCRGLILWPEASHIDAFLLDWYVENAWDAFKDRGELLRSFCAGRYAGEAKRMERLWSSVMALPVQSFVCWGGNFANREPWDVVTFWPELNQTGPGLWSASEQLPKYASVPGLLRDLVQVDTSDAFVRRDVIDLARTLADRLIFGLKAELINSFHRWRADGLKAERLNELARTYSSLGGSFADLLEQHTDYSLYDSFVRLGKAGKMANPDFGRVLIDNATCTYCRTHQYEAARHWYAPAMRDLAAQVLRKTACGDRSGFDIDTLASNDYRRVLLETPLATLRPTAVRTGENLSRVLRALADEADAVFAEPSFAPYWNGTLSAPDWTCSLPEADLFLRFMALREPVATAADRRDCAALLEKLERLRQDDPVYANGPLVRLRTDRKDEAVAYMRMGDEGCGVLALANVTDRAILVKVRDVDASGLMPALSARCRVVGEAFELGPGGYVAGDIRRSW